MIVTFDIRSSWFARCALQCMQLYLRWQLGRYAWNVFTILPVFGFPCPRSLEQSSAPTEPHMQSRSAPHHQVESMLPMIGTEAQRPAWTGGDAVVVCAFGDTLRTLGIKLL